MPRAGSSGRAHPNEPAPQTTRRPNGHRRPDHAAAPEIPTRSSRQTSAKRFSRRSRQRGMAPVLPTDIVSHGCSRPGLGCKATVSAEEPPQQKPALAPTVARAIQTGSSPWDRCRPLGGPLAAGARSTGRVAGGLRADDKGPIFWTQRLVLPAGALPAAFPVAHDSSGCTHPTSWHQFRHKSQKPGLPWHERAGGNTELASRRRFPMGTERN